MAFLSSSGCASLLLAIALAATSDPDPISIVDYMKSIKADSSFANRKAEFVKVWPAETYKGTAEQNLKLLKHFLSSRSEIRIPFPSKKVDNCEKFYNDAEISKKLTEAFRKNAIVACVVTGTKTSAETIRVKLQEEYIAATPANGKHFTAAEHKEIHDRAYKAAGCKEPSAKIIGWIIVDLQELPAMVVKKSIEWFGECTVQEEK